MVDHLDTEDTAGFDHGASEVEVLAARLGIARRMVMGKHNRAGVASYGWSEDLAGFDRHVSDCAKSHHLKPDQAQTDI